MTNDVKHSRVSAAALFLGAVVCVIGFARPADAQGTSGLFIDVHAAAQLGVSAIDTETVFTLYGENANIRTRQDPGASGLFDLRFGYRFRPAFGVGISFSGSVPKYTGTVAASLPDPVLINTYKNITQDVDDLTRRELGYHPQFLYFVPLREKVELTLAAGPSFVQVSQPVIKVDVIPGTQNLSISVPKNTEFVIGVNVGADVNYLITPRFSAGLFYRFVAGSKDFTDIAGVSVTSSQIGGGIRVRF